MKKYEEIYEEVKRRLSYKRFNHCICTMKRAEEYAKKYKQDQEKIKLVALTHDIAREIKKEVANESLEFYVMNDYEGEREMDYAGEITGGPLDIDIDTYDFNAV